MVVESCNLIAYRLGDRWHLRDTGVKLRTELAMQQAAHVLALGHAVGDALAMELVDDLFQPEMNIDGLRAERGTAWQRDWEPSYFQWSASGLRDAARGAAGGART